MENQYDFIGYKPWDLATKNRKVILVVFYSFVQPISLFDIIFYNLLITVILLQNPSCVGING